MCSKVSNRMPFAHAILTTLWIQLELNFSFFLSFKITLLMVRIQWTYLASNLIYSRFVFEMYTHDAWRSVASSSSDEREFADWKHKQFFWRRFEWIGVFSLCQTRRHSSHRNAEKDRKSDAQTRRRTKQTTICLKWFIYCWNYAHRISWKWFCSSVCKYVKHVYTKWGSMAR